MPVRLKLRWIRTRKRLVIGHGDRLSEADHVRPFFRRNQAKFALNLGLYMVGAGFWRRTMSGDRDAEEEES